jgi:hypothetical protein
MPPNPAIPVVLELGQTALNFTGQYKAKRLGKVSKPECGIPLRRSSGIVNGAHQWIAGESNYEAVLACQFEAARTVNWDDDESDPGSLPLHRNSYSRELKLAAVQWALNT